MSKELTYYQRNREAILEKRRRYVALNKDKCLASDRSYYARVGKTQEHKAKQHARHLLRWADPKYRSRENARMIERAKRPEVQRRLKAAHKRRYADPEYRAKIQKSNRAWMSANMDRKKAAEKIWRNNNRDLSAASLQKRRALIKKASVNLAGIRTFFKKVKSKATVICYYCQQPTPGKGCHFDHIVPLSKGGLHGVENLCVTCPSCNNSKHVKQLESWVRIGQQVLAL